MRNQAWALFGKFSTAAVGQAFRLGKIPFSQRDSRQSQGAALVQRFDLQGLLESDAGAGDIVRLQSGNAEFDPEIGLLIDREIRRHQAVDIHLLFAESVTCLRQWQCRDRSIGAQLVGHHQFFFCLLGIAESQLNPPHQDACRQLSWDPVSASS